MSPKGKVYDIKDSPNFDKVSYRLNYPAAFLEAMPVMEVTKDELYELMGTMAYNPTPYYRDKVKLHPHEVGHDDKYRYVTKGKV